MVIKFLRDCKAPQEKYTVHCECCGPEPDGWVEQYFLKDEEIDPEESQHKIDLTGLEYRVDYDIIKYP